jgi:hypothetical protein
MKLTKQRQRWLIVGAVVLAALAALNPSYSRVSVGGPDGITVEKTSFGPRVVGAVTCVQADDNKIHIEVQ